MATARDPSLSPVCKDLLLGDAERRKIVLSSVVGRRRKYRIQGQVSISEFIKL